MELLDMSDECLEEILGFCDADSLVAISQTCKKLNGIAKPLFIKKTSYNCVIFSEEQAKIAKRTIANIGAYLTELDVIDLITYGDYNQYDDFLRRLPQKCPNLQNLSIACNASPNMVFGSVHTLDKLLKLVVNSPTNEYVKVNISYVLKLARELKQLREFQANGVQWDRRIIYPFLWKAKNLKSFLCDVDRKPFELNKQTLERIRASESPGQDLDILISFKITQGDEWFYGDSDEEELMEEESDDEEEEEEEELDDDDPDYIP